MMKVCVIGTGYVGLVVGACLAEMGNNVICVDNDKEKINNLKNGIVPIYEPGLEEIIKTNINENRLTYTIDTEYAIKNSLICYIAVGTPQDEDGSADLNSVFQVVEKIANSINDYKIIVDKSTVPIGTAEKIAEFIKQKTSQKFDIVSNPEFLKQGNAVEDFLKPDRVIIGSNSKKAIEIMQELYSPFVRTGNPIIITDTKSAEMIKYASNTFLALKVSYANEIANLCEETGANYDMVRAGMSADKRIGSQFLFSGIGYGGSCFPKDIKALIKTAKDVNYNSDLINSIEKVNKNQQYRFIEKILKKYNYNLKDKLIAIWGLAFKPKTNDMREAPSITIINELLNKGAKIIAFDPKAKNNAEKIFENRILFAQSSYEAIKNADCLLLLTEWNEFRRPDFDKIKELMKTPIIFDGRNQYEGEKLIERGFEYYRTGKIY